ncbi:MAG: hypothetical protein H6618_09420 [Deltaproteobacteria bacterium]|nr:hypothetical protein [Deltaproteobacteria bacterium]
MMPAVISIASESFGIPQTEDPKPDNTLSKRSYKFSNSVQHNPSRNGWVFSDFICGGDNSDVVQFLTQLFLLSSLCIFPIMGLNAWLL